MSRRTLIGAWLLVALVVVGLVAARYFRSYGMLGVIVPVIGLFAVVAAARLLGPWTVGAPRQAQPPPPRDVTPRQEALSSSPTIARRPTTAPVVVIEPSTPAAESVEARLATLDRLRDDGRLSSAEYEAKRAQLIAEI